MIESFIIALFPKNYAIFWSKFVPITIRQSIFSAKEDISLSTFNASSLARQNFRQGLLENKKR